MKSIIYCRVSTEGQEQDGTSLQTQLEACQKHCASKGYEVLAVFSEAFSGLSLERPKLAQLRELVRTDQIDALVVYSLDRFSRDPVHGVILMQELEKHNVLLEAATESVDNSEVGKLVFYIKGYAAKLDAERRRDATGRGKQAVLKSGTLPQGCGIGIYGYRWDSATKKRIPLEHEAKVVQSMFQMVAGGKSVFSVARALNEASVPSKSGRKWEARTVSRIVRNPAYCGLTYFGQTSRVNGKLVKKPADSWVLLPDVTPPIITSDLFDDVQDKLAKSKELHPGRAKHDYPLTGFAVCDKCGSPLVGSCLRGNYRYYHCRGTYMTSSRDRICDERYIKADWFEGVVWDKVKGVLQNPELLLTELGKLDAADARALESGDLEKDIRDITRRLKAYPGQERRLMNALRMEVASPDVILDELNQMKRERDADEKRLISLNDMKDHLAKSVDIEAHLKELCSKVVADLDNCTAQDKKDAFTYLDLKVKASSQSIEIKGYVDLNVLTTGQTSGCMSCDLKTPFDVPTWTRIILFSTNLFNFSNLEFWMRSMMANPTAYSSKSSYPKKLIIIPFVRFSHL
jgi:site-specific DNA recombinase